MGLFKFNSSSDLMHEQQQSNYTANYYITVKWGVTEGFYVVLWLYHINADWKEDFNLKLHTSRQCFLFVLFTCEQKEDLLLST